MQNQIITVSLLGNYLKKIIDSEELLNNITVEGEISSYSISGGNAYFTIKDDSALLSCVLFSARNFYIPQIGDKVLVAGTPRFYVKGGKLNFNASNIQKYGEGELYKRFLELKAKLEKEGLFAVEHKKAMPQDIKRIGIVTSETGAVFQDILNVTRRRQSSQDIVLYPVKVQGIGADREIAKGVEFFSNYNVDAIIVGRGGGSEEDLQNFNSEIVARAIYACNKFVVSAVGHETDFSICDYVADLRAPTPSAAAELLTKDGTERKSRLQLFKQNIVSLINNKISMSAMHLKDYKNQIANVIDKKIDYYDNLLKLKKVNLENNNPLNILNKGYAKVMCDGKTVKSVENIVADKVIDVYVADGKFKSRVIEVNKK